MKNKAKAKRSTCLNCGNTFKGGYCPHCGQKAGTKRLKLSEIVMDFANSFVGGDNKFLHTCRDLCCRPGIMVRDYLTGKRTKYYNPLQLYVFILTAFAVASYMMSESSSVLDHIEILDLNLEDLESEYATLNVINSCFKKLSYNKLYGTLILSFLAVFPFHRVFHSRTILRPDGTRTHLNHTEQFYAQMYFSCIGLLVSIVLLPFCLIKNSDGVVQHTYQVLSMVYATCLYKQLYGLGWIKGALLTALAFFMTFVLTIGLIVMILFTDVLIEEVLKQNVPPV